MSLRVTRNVTLTIDHQIQSNAEQVLARTVRQFDARGAAAIVMDPRTGRPVEGILSVAVVTESGTRGDALDNAFFVVGVERTRERLRTLPGTEVVFFLPKPRSGWRSVRRR